MSAAPNLGADSTLQPFPIKLATTVTRLNRLSSAFGSIIDLSQRGVCHFFSDQPVGLAYLRADSFRIPPESGAYLNEECE
jgi:hypothetical protein